MTEETLLRRNGGSLADYIIAILRRVIHGGTAFPRASEEVKTSIWNGYVKVEDAEINVDPSVGITRNFLLRVFTIYMYFSA